MKTLMILLCLHGFIAVAGVTLPGPNPLPTATPANGTWTDAVLTPKESIIKAIHINELRALVNSKRLTCSLPTKLWTDDPIVAKLTPIKKIHMDELRIATTELVLASTGAAGGPPVFTDPNIIAKQTIVKTSHVAELRLIASNAFCAAPPPGPVIPPPGPVIPPPGPVIPPPGPVIPPPGPVIPPPGPVVPPPAPVPVPPPGAYVKCKNNNGTYSKTGGPYPDAPTCNASLVGCPLCSCFPGLFCP